MSILALVAVLAQLQVVSNAPTGEACVKMTALVAGQTAPCAGILWSEDQTRAAVICKDVSLPTLEAELKLVRNIADIRERQHRVEVNSRNVVIKQMIDNWPKPVNADAWQIVASVLGGVITGAAAAIFLM